MKDVKLGEIVIRKSGRAKSFIARVRYGVLHLTVPTFVSEKSIRKFIDENRESLMKLKAAQPFLRIGESFTIDADEYVLHLKLGRSTKSTLHVEGKIHTLLLKQDFSFEEDEAQQWLRKVIEETLVTRAKQVFPPVLQDLANKHSLSFSRVSINRAKTRWGSCSIDQSINLSCYALLLPTVLFRYVMLHELAHTLHMNHGEKFWACLDLWTEGRAKALNLELRGYKLPF